MSKFSNSIKKVLRKLFRSNKTDFESAIRPFGLESTHVDFRFKVTGEVGTLLKRFDAAGLIEGKHYVRHIDTTHYSKFGSYQFAFMLTGEAFAVFLRR